MAALGVVGCLAVVALLMASTSSGIFVDDSAKAGDVADLFAKQAQVYGAYVWAYFVLAAALVVVLGRPAGGPDAGNCVQKSAESAFQPPHFARRPLAAMEPDQSAGS